MRRTPAPEFLLCVGFASEFVLGKIDHGSGQLLWVTVEAAVPAGHFGIREFR